MALTAVPVGFVAGLFGIGGGLITVPFLYYIFNNAGINPDYIMHLAVGTSFAIIIPTSTVSVMTHHPHVPLPGMHTTPRCRQTKGI